MANLLLVGLLAAGPVGTLTLTEAMQVGASNQPQLRQLHAQTQAAEAATDVAFAPLLPQVVATGRYTRQSTNQTSQVVGGQPASHNFFDSVNVFNFGITATQLVYDFGQTTGQYHAAQASEGATAANEAATRIIALANVRSSFFAARADKALVLVAKRTLANQEKHLAQIEGFVEAKIRPGIDLVKARTDLANAKFQEISAEGNYAIGKAALNQAMGVAWPTTYEVSDETIGSVPGETGSIDPLVEQALKQRPEFVGIQKQIEAAEDVERSARGSYGPSISVSANFTEFGNSPAALNPSWSAGATATWPLFTGLSTPARVRQARANVLAVTAQRETLRAQVRLAIEQARLQIQSALAGTEAADEALKNAEEQLNLAEGRYAAGVGTILELDDAQLAETQASAQKVQSEYTLATARSQLLVALGKLPSP